MNKKDINVTPATNASLSVTVGDVIADSQDNKATIVYIDYVGDIVVAVDGSEATNISFNVLAGGEYQQVVGDQVMGYYVPIADVSPDIGYQRMPRESINVVKGTREGIKVVKATISLVVCDKIVDNRGKIFEVAYIDYARENIIAVSIGNIISGSRATVIRFDTIACGGYLKVIQQIMELENIVVILIALLSILLLGLIVLKQNLGALVGGNFLIAWLLWLHLIHPVSLHTYWVVKPILRVWFF